jgi:hypothetical protein
MVRPCVEFWLGRGYNLLFFYESHVEQGKDGSDYVVSRNSCISYTQSNEIVETTLTTTIHTFRTPYIQRNQKKGTVLQTLWQETLVVPFA